MNAFQRLELVDRIGRELQSRMTYGEIKTYLKVHGVDTAKTTSNVNSKWVYSKDLLSDEPEVIILRIADELGVPHNHVVMEPGKLLEANLGTIPSKALSKSPLCLQGTYRRASESTSQV